MNEERLFGFAGGTSGEWRVTGQVIIRGEPLPTASHVRVRPLAYVDAADALPGQVWLLRGARSHERYTNRAEHQRLSAAAPALNRVEATSGALIPIRKSAAWWALAQDERRTIFEERSRHISGTLKYLPAIARRLYHSRDLGEPFDFLTWFEFAPADAATFDQLLADLRSSEEWTFVDREIEIRLQRESALSMA
ncbi:MAG: chlorite dismutase family protein [Phycisphaerae bacterium]|nr:chlorite dismutase family protein [Phycisphaerae bacterium]